MSQLKNNQYLDAKPKFYILKQTNMRTLAPFLVIPLHIKVMLYFLGTDRDWKSKLKR